jgi:hypothetical protein
VKYLYTRHQRENEYQTKKWCDREGMVTGDCLKSEPIDKPRGMWGTIGINKLGQCICPMRKEFPENSLGNRYQHSENTASGPVCRKIWRVIPYR